MKYLKMFLKDPLHFLPKTQVMNYYTENLIPKENNLLELRPFVDLIGEKSSVVQVKIHKKNCLKKKKRTQNHKIYKKENKLN